MELPGSPRNQCLWNPLCVHHLQKCAAIFALCLGSVLAPTVDNPREDLSLKPLPMHTWKEIRLCCLSQLGRWEGIMAFTCPCPVRSTDNSYIPGRRKGDWLVLSAYLPGWRKADWLVLSTRECKALASFLSSRVFPTVWELSLPGPEELGVPHIPAGN